MTRKEKSSSHSVEKVEKAGQDEVEELGAQEETKAEDTGPVRKALEEEKEKAEKYLANWQRAQADLINYKRRSEQERAETTGFANSTLILSLLPILDDMERALGNLPEELAGSSWVDGVKIIYRKMRAVLESQGLAEIEAEGKDFDPNIHEAVMAVEGDEGKVVGEIRKGYKFREKVIRPTQVKVGKGEA